MPADCPCEEMERRNPLLSSTPRLDRHAQGVLHIRRLSVWASRTHQ